MGKQSEALHSLLNVAVEQMALVHSSCIRYFISHGEEDYEVIVQLRPRTLFTTETPPQNETFWAKKENKSQPEQPIVSKHNGVLVHADGGDCHGTPLVGLHGGYQCPKCGIAPDMQSTEIWSAEEVRAARRTSNEKTD